MVPSAQSMWRSWIILGALVIGCAWLSLRQGGVERLQEGVLSGGRLFLGVLPNLVLGFLLAGFLHVLLPGDLIVQWLGAEAGSRGLWVGTLGGALTPGGPFTHFPILASFLAKGAGVGPVCAYIAAWALLGVNRFLVWEWPILGSQVAMARFAVCVWVPPVVGWLGGRLYQAVIQ